MCEGHTPRSILRPVQVGCQILCYEPREGWNIGITSLSAILAEAVAIMAKQEIVQRERTCAVVVAVRIGLTRVPAGTGVVWYDGISLEQTQ